MSIIKNKGFTLLEILIALFIFTILSVILVVALRSVIDAQSGTEKNAKRLHVLQITLLMMSRDIEQTVNRPVLNASGKEEAAFIGSPENFTFTHAGLAYSIGVGARSSLERTQYTWHDQALWRTVTAVLDQAPTTRSSSRRLLGDVVQAHFEYLDQKGRFQDHWPLEDQADQPLPRAIRVYFTISQWGEISQLYVISAEPSQTTELPTQSSS